MIDQTDIHGALMAHLEVLSLWLSPAPVIVWPGLPASKAPYWLRVTHLPNVPDRSSLDGSTPLDHMGILQIDLMDAPGQHEVVYLARAQAVIAHFPQTLRMKHGSAVVKVVKSYRLGGRATGDHWMTPVRVEYAVEAA